MYKIKTSAKCHVAPELRIPASQIMTIQKFEIASQESIVFNFRACSKDPMGFASTVFGSFITYENAKVFLPESVTEEDYKYVSDLEEGVQDMLDYLVFAIETCKLLVSGEIDPTTTQGKIVSARSGIKLSAYLLCLGRHDLYTIFQNKASAHPHCLPQIKELCSRFGIDLPKELLKLIV